MTPEAADGQDTGEKTPAPAGIIVLDKPAGPTSRELVNRVAALLPRVKVGHAGTLDPLASGILVVCIGVATRLTEIIQHLSKSYKTVIRLGARSDTHDALGQIAALDSPNVPSMLEVRQSLGPLLGKVLQQPPEYSALKLKGKRAYDLARAGQLVELAPRFVQIDRIEVLGYTWPLLELEIDCSKGTYIRAIARDLGEALGCGGYVETLKRTRIGPFTREQAIDPRELSREKISTLLRPPLDAVAHLKKVVIDSAGVAAVVQGRTIALPADIGPPDVEAGLVALLDQDSRLVALAEPDFEQRRLQPRKVLIASP
jgi:tRNA pseudouridine55 synthase